jgi:hypothetical protein
VTQAAVGPKTLLGSQSTRCAEAFSLLIAIGNKDYMKKWVLTIAAAGAVLVCGILISQSYLRANESEFRGTIAVVQKSLDAYKDEFGHYPESKDKLESVVPIQETQSYRLYFDQSDLPPDIAAKIDAANLPKVREVEYSAVLVPRVLSSYWHFSSGGHVDKIEIR